MTLVEAFASGLDPARRERIDADVAATLDAMLAEGAAAWPGVRVDAPSFVRFVAERAPPDEPLSRALATLRPADLFIAFACASGDPRAIAAFEQRYFSEVASAVRRAPRARLAPEDVAQIVRERLFVALPGASPRILDYRGQAPIRAWLRVAAARIVVNLATRGPREQPEDDDLFGRIVTDGDPAEIAHLKEKYRGEFRAALEAAVSAIDPKDKVVLAYAFRDKLSIDAIGRIYGVHRATAARWIAKAQESLVAETRRALAQRLRATEEEVDSIVRLIASRFDVSFGGLLG